MQRLGSLCIAGKIIGNRVTGPVVCILTAVRISMGRLLYATFEDSTPYPSFCDADNAKLMFCPICSYILTPLFARGLLIALKMEAASTSETSINFYQTTQSNIQRNSQLHTRRRENPKPHLLLIFFTFLSDKTML
jgi:hypothetical protein